MATPPVTGDQRFVRQLNRSVLLRLLQRQPGLSRADLALHSGLTRSTVSALAQALIDEGWLVEASANITGARGRRPTPLSLDGQRLMLVGADLSPDAICVVAVSLDGQVQQVLQSPLRSARPEAACHQLVEMVTALSSRVVQAGARPLGIGVGLHGAVDTRSGLLLLAPNIGWRNLEVGRTLAAELARAGLGGLPVFCHNEADLAAVGESEFGPRPVADPLVYVSCGVGVGAGIILNQVLFTGATGSAGEIGHTTLVADGAPCSCGRLGCAEAYLGLRAIAAAAGCLRGGTVDRERLASRMAGRHAAARSAFTQAGRSLGVLLQNVWTTFNPQAIVLGGETVTLGGQTLLDAAAAVLDDVAGRVGLPAPTVRLARHGERAAAVGGAAYVLHQALNPHQAAPSSQAARQAVA